VTPSHFKPTIRNTKAGWELSPGYTDVPLEGIRSDSRQRILSSQHLHEVRIQLGTMDTVAAPARQSDKFSAESFGYYVLFRQFRRF
jgi:hypothetical protein